MKKIILFYFICTALSLHYSFLFSQTTYYSKSSGNLNVAGTWGINANGTGTSPVNFTSNNCTYIIVNQSAPTISGNWTVSGTNSKVQIGDGTQAVNFSVPSPRTFNATVNVMGSSTLTAVSGSTISSCVVSVANNADLVIQSAANPAFGTLAAGSTVTYSRAAAQTIANATYYKLVLGGSGTKTLAGTANTTVNTDLNIGSGIIFALNTVTTYTCILNGTLSGSGTIKGGTSSCLTIGGSGVFGTIIPSSSPLTLYNLTVNRGSAGTVTLGGNVTVSTAPTFSAGVVDINGNTLTLNGALVLPASSASGSFAGSSTSALSIGATSISNNLYFKAGSQTLNNFTLNSSGQTLALGSDLTISGAYTHTRGIVNINGNTLSLTGTATFASSATNGTTSGSSSSSLLISATTITNSFFMTTGAQTLNNLTLNSPGKTLTLGTAVTVIGTFTQTNGIVKLNGQVFTLNGPVVFPAASANGTITGSNTSDLSISSGSVSNTLYFTTGGQAIRNFTVNCPSQIVNLGTSLTVATSFTHTKGILALSGANTLTLNGAVTFPSSVANGSISGSATSVISIGGSGAFTNSMYMTQGGTSSYLNNFTLNRTGQTLTLGNTLNIVGAVTPTAGTLVSNGNLVLTATSYSVTGRIGVIGASGNVTGNVTAQMYAKGGNTGWTLMSSPGLTGRTFSDWDDNITITCLNCPDGYSVGGTNFGSVQLYSETVGGLYTNSARYTEIQNITDAMTQGKGYWVYLGNGTTTTTDIILDATGPINKGNFAITLTETNSGGGTNATDHGYNLIANPYPSPIRWSLLLNSNVNVANAIYVYDPDLNGYTSYVNGVSSTTGTGRIGDTIPIGQGFYVKANAASVTLTAKESNKSGTIQALLRTSNQQQSNPNPMAMYLQASGNSMQFETAIYFDPGATMNLDQEYDAVYMGPDPGRLGIATSLNGYDYSINGLPALNQNFGIPVKVTTGVTGSYQIAGINLQNLPGGACLILHDNYTGADQNLRNGPYSCTISDTESVARFQLNIGINNNLVVSGNSVNPSCMQSGNGYLVASANGTGPWNYYWKDASSSIIRTALNKISADTLDSLDAGNYSVDINTSGTCDNGSQSFSLQGSSSPVASFNPSATSVVLVQDTVSVSFTNTSGNADSYWWDFGDGNGSSDTNAVNYYASVGEYTVTLIAYNAACHDSSITTQVITVTDTITTAVQSAVEMQKKMFISRDRNGYFVQFDLNAETSADISVEDIFGEQVMRSIHKTKVLSDKVYIPFESSEKVIILNVVTGSGERVYCKIVNY